MLLLAGCSGQGDDDTSSIKTIHIFQFKVEMAEAFNRLKVVYEKEHPGVKLDIQTVGGGSNYGASLRAKFSSGKEPDIFNIGGYRELEMWQDYLEDLTSEPWVKDVKQVAKEPMTLNGHLYGQPMNLEGYGFIYNKDLFEKAGIKERPVTLSQLEEACKKLKAAGIIPFANGYQEAFVLGNHNINLAFAYQKNPSAFIKGLTQHTQTFAGNEVVEKWSDLLDLTLKYGNANPLTTDYNTQVTLLATGKAAMMQQGNWTQGQLDGINPKLNLGILPMPITDEAGSDKLFVGVPNNWVVYKNSPVKQEAKDFLNWLVSSKEGKQYITKEFKFIPALDTIKPTKDELGPLGMEVLKYTDAGQVLTWNWFRFPNGMSPEFASSIQSYIGGKSTKAEMYTDFQRNWDNLSVK
nr:ABC transporter substrate-binding protein [Paenibacillus shirakamiensis]